MGVAVVLNGDQVYMEELIRENARLTVQVEAERRQRRELEVTLARLKHDNELLSSRADQADADFSLAMAELDQRKISTTKLNQAVKDLHTIMAGGDACAVCKNECKMGVDCKPRWKGIDD